MPILDNPLFRVTNQRCSSWAFVLNTKREYVRVLVINEPVNIVFGNERYRDLALKLNTRNQQFQEHVLKTRNKNQIGFGNSWPIHARVHTVNNVLFRKKIHKKKPIW